MHNVLICDDRKPIAVMIKCILEKYADTYDLKLIALDNGADLLNYFYENNADIVYLDVDLGKENGLDIAKILKSINPDILIIYISAYNIYFKDMVNAEPFRFISKSPDDPGSFEKGIEKALVEAIRRIDRLNGFSFEFNKKEYIVDLDRIEYFHSTLRTIHIYGDTDGAPNYFYGKMDELQESLQKIDDNFVRINKSCIVNRKFTYRIGKYQVLICGKEFNVAQKYRKEFEKHNWRMLIR